MTGSVVLVHLAGAVALLLWATRMVRTGVERAYGDVLRRKLRGTLKNPLLAVAAGGALAIAFQSATAVSLLVGSFAGSGIVSSAAGLVAVLGADLGSAFVVKLLTFDLSLLVPAALFTGTAIFLATERRAWRQFGRILVGVGLLILSLQLIGDASEPLRESRILPVIINYLSGDPITAFLIAALATWLFHSSVAFILLVVALAARGLVPAELGVVMVLGANLGGGLIAAMLSRAMPPASRTVPLGNLVIRGIGAMLALTGLVWFAPPLDMLGASAPLQLVHAHIAFNLALVILGLPFAGLVTRGVERWASYAAPAAPVTLEDKEASALDPEALGTPSRALANVTRAVVGVCETVEVMLKNIMELYEEPDRARMDALAALDDRVDRKHAAIKLYLARITTDDMSEDEERRTGELLDACVKLEQVGDIIVRNMLVHVKKKLDRGLTFTPEGWRELSNLHASVLSNARLAFNVLISRDSSTALQLVREKDRMRDIERETSQRHFERLREGAKKSLETSTLHLDTIRDLKQINSLLASIAYPVLEEQGLLGGTRLKAAE
ncbi:Na/Pi cotransporter family protein [Mesorhizobium microcysteis]|uniref:Na/Pi cotransporter family protein n=1 Tax=Neoaquamicrobium microcysteis TaxID=2682781 RepID=A0A5D4GRI4_9HYPH|nr:Na/Pi cotransporter family protein [Mesorhizobium microcysteis]TYR30553.1 Na/Pi cotransporter family protein [Mesorhizobium microcysteis]